jgi:Uma2 family endonuclease
MQGIKTPPRTIGEVFKSLPEGTLAELIDGTLYMSPAPSPKHQRIVGRIFTQLSSYVLENNLGEVFLSPCDVFFDEHSNAVQPDLIFISSQNSSLVGQEAIHGAPDLLIEVLSPGNSNHDLIRKKGLYEKFGVKEYWIIDPDTKETIGYFLKDGIYISLGTFSGKIRSAQLQQEFAF